MRAVGAKYQAFKEAPYKDDFDEWLARIVCFAFSLPPTAFIRQLNRATAEQSQDTAASEGLAPLMGWVKRLADQVIQEVMGEADLEFAWGDVRAADPAEQAKVIDTHVRSGVYAVNDVLPAPIDSEYTFNNTVNRMRFYAPIAKVDAEQRMVWGYASTEAEDDQGETITRDALAAALGDYLKFADIREMHQMSAVGVAEEAGVDDKGLYVGARIVDPRAWDKVTSGVYKGFSVGGRVKARDPRDRNVITALSLTEISLVDRPANPEAVFDCWKAEAGEGMAGDIDYADPGYQADGQKRYPLDSERHIRAAWAFVHMAGHAAAYTAGELQRVKDRIAAAWRAEIDPAGPPAAAAAGSNAIASQAALDHVHDCLKAMTGGECCGTAKAGRRQRGTMLDHLKQAHDALCRAGASCDRFAADDEQDGAADAEADKAAHANDLMKAFAGEILPRIDALAQRIAELEAMPLPPATMARTPGSISKREDGGYPGVSPEEVVAVLSRMSDDDRTLALIKAAHANPIRPFR